MKAKRLEISHPGKGRRSQHNQVSTNLRIRRGIHHINDDVAPPGMAQMRQTSNGGDRWQGKHAV
eukprot:scaffold1720_cov238-Pinguiococcus_pyrenoidosus.AAC.10